MFSQLLSKHTQKSRYMIVNTKITMAQLSFVKFSNYSVSFSLYMSVRGVRIYTFLQNNKANLSVPPARHVNEPKMS